MKSIFWLIPQSKHRTWGPLRDIGPWGGLKQQKRGKKRYFKGKQKSIYRQAAFFVQ